MIFKKYHRCGKSLIFACIFLIISFSNAYTINTGFHKEFIIYNSLSSLSLNYEWLDKITHSEKRYPKFVSKDIIDARNIINDNYENNNMLYLGWTPNIKHIPYHYPAIYQIISEIISKEKTLSIYKIALNPIYITYDIPTILLKHDLCELSKKYGLDINFKSLYNNDYERWYQEWNILY